MSHARPLAATAGSRRCRACSARTTPRSLARAALVSALVMRRARAGAALLTALLASAVAGGARAQVAVPSGTLEALSYRYVGPVGNRVSAVTGVPGDINTYYIGAASGGIFKSSDAGHSWEPVFDDQPVASIGSLAVAPSDPNVVWAGTGETFIRSNVSHGAGIYRSTDAGRTWLNMGLEETGRIGRIVVHPTDPDVVYAAATGHLYGPQEERGVFRTLDGGRTWERVLFTDENTGASDIIMDPTNPRILFAGMWTMLIRTWGRWSGGPGGGLFMSRDGGDTWTRLEGRGLPSGTTGKIGLAMSPDDPMRVYALIETNANREFEPLEEHEGVLWRSDDGGSSWTMVNADHTLVQRPHYYSRAVVSPDDADEVHFMATRHSVSLNGGATSGGGGAGGDNHDMWIDPLIPDRMIVGHDQGVSISTNRGESWYRPQLPIAQMYHVTTDTEVPYHLFGNRQDGSSSRGPSNSLTGGSIPIGAWRSVGGCESGWSVPDTVSNDVVWSGCYEGILERHQVSTGHARTVSVWPDNPEGWEAAPLRYRFQWTFPIHVSPHDPERVYVGSQHVHRTTNAGQSWDVISPDLTTDDEEKQRRSGGLTPDDVSPTYYSVLFAIAESPLEEGVIWAGSNDGLIHVTRDGGATWTDVTPSGAGMPPLATVSSIDPSKHAAGTAFVAVDAHQLGDFDPYLFRTDDYGATWRRIDSDIPRSALSFTHVLREDPKRAGLLYAGTGNAIYASLDAGASWFSLQSNLPHAPVHDLTVQPHFDDLVVATYGRGFWIMDDVTPLQRLSDDVVASEVHLFAPRPAYRFLSRASASSQPGDPAAGRNPEYGASLSYWLGEGTGASRPSLEILDGAGAVVASVRASASEGLNRVHWNLRYEPSRTPRIRTPPVEHGHAGLGGAEFRGPPDGGRVSPLAPPGRYTVRLSVGGLVVEQPLEVLQDPTSTGTPDGIRAQFAMQMDLREDANRATDAIDRIEWLRKQIADVRVRVAGDRSVEDEGALSRAAEQLDAALLDVESNLFDPRLTGGSARQDGLRWPRQLYAKITSLAGYVSGTDDPPTDQAREVHALYRERLADVEARLAAVIDEQVANFNRMLIERGLTPIT